MVEYVPPPITYMQIEEKAKTKKTAIYQWYTYRTGRQTVKLPWKCGHRLYHSQAFVEGRYTRITLFERLTGKFRLFLDLNLISRYQHSHNSYALGFEEPKRNP